MQEIYQNGQVSVVDVISQEEIAECQALADKMEIPLRVRAKEN